MKSTTFFKTLIMGAGLVTSMVMSPASFAGGNCTEYRLSAYGGDAGFRVMVGSRDFRKASNGSVIGKICHSGNVQIELAKRHPGTRVSLAVNGREYVFGEGDRGDRHVNNWFRRYVHVDLGHYSKPTHKPHKWKGKDHDNSSFGYNHRYNDDYVDNRYRGRDHAGYSDHYNDQGVYYNHKPQKGSYGSYKSYDNDYVDHSHGHKWKRHHKLPRFAIHSKRHRKAHRRDIPHRHKRPHHQRYVTYY
ncbi:MAG: hypothetical protein KTR18_06850 [Acidiferrobacterales bacterium]|nr:hypothetical protein [Acidiferrobacterales bacterium]